MTSSLPSYITAATVNIAQRTVTSTYTYTSLLFEQIVCVLLKGCRKIWSSIKSTPWPSPAGSESRWSCSGGTTDGGLGGAASREAAQH